MAVDRAELTANLHRFYDFTGKVVLYVGAGGGQLLDPYVNTKKLIAIDRNVKALNEFRRNIAVKGMEDCVEAVSAKFEDVLLRGDVVYFEFCLHELADPQKALAHARTLAPDVVVFDHLHGSEWAYYAAEEEKVRRSGEAMKRFGIRRRETFRTAQRFKDHAELLVKMAEQGHLAIQRAQLFAGSTDIVIPMPCELAVL
ncbi:MAG: methyltransferase domain-containing protein [Candidatus Acidiferrum sp.]